MTRTYTNKEQVQKQSLSEQTQEYWRLSQIRNGRIEAKITTQTALTRLGKLLQTVGPQRKLAGQLGLLMADIISPKKVSKSKLQAPIPFIQRSNIQGG